MDNNPNNIEPLKFYRVQNSSQIAQIAYDAPSRNLYVKFKSGGLYVYFQVPSDVADQFLRAQSAGKFLGCNVRGKYDYQRLADDHDAFKALVPEDQEGRP